LGESYNYSLYLFSRVQESIGDEIGKNKFEN
jgi:hypothetical protein